MLVQVAALFYIGTTKSHPPIPEHLSVEAKDFLLKCLQKYVIFIVFYSLLKKKKNFFDVLNIHWKTSFSWSKLFLKSSFVDEQLD